MNPFLLLDGMRRVRRMLPAEKVPRFYLIFASQLVNSALDLLSLGLFVPILPYLLDPTAFEGSRLGGFLSAIFRGLDAHGVIYATLAALIGLFLVKNLATLWIQKLQAEFAFDLYRHYSTRLQRYYGGMDFLGMQSTHSADIIHEIGTLCAWFSQNYVLQLLSLCNEALVLALILAGIGWYSPVAAGLVALCLLPPFAIFYGMVRERIRSYFAHLNDISLRIKKNLADFVFGYVDMKMTGTEETFYRDYADLARSYSRLLTKNYVLNLIPTRILEMALVVGASALAVYSLAAIDAPAERITLLGVFFVAAYRIFPSINRISMALLLVRGHVYTLEVIEKLASAAPPRDPAAADLTFASTVEFDGVAYAYPGAKAPVLRGLDLTIQRGEMVGLVGPSGEGKSTFLHLLLGLLFPTDGEIRVDGSKLDAARAWSWHRLIGYVRQEVYLCAGGIAQNVAFGVPAGRIDPARLRRAIELARLTEVVADKGDAADLGERGAFLSVGQKQRIGIARAIYAGAEVLVFDEATSALDAKTEAEITDTIAALHRSGFTVVLVAHRASTLKACTRVYEIRQGRFAPRESPPSK